MIQNKNLLKKVAKDWVKGIIASCQTDAFWDSIDEGLLTHEEASYIVEYTKEIAKKISKEPTLQDLQQILKRHFDYEIL